MLTLADVHFPEYDLILQPTEGPSPTYTVDALQNVKGEGKTDAEDDVNI